MSIDIKTNYLLKIYTIFTMIKRMGNIEGGEYIFFLKIITPPFNRYIKFEHINFFIKIYINL